MGITSVLAHSDLTPGFIATPDWNICLHHQNGDSYLINSPTRAVLDYIVLKKSHYPKRVLHTNLETRITGTPRNKWNDNVREDGRIVGW
jgi:hypothetical protein